MPSKSPWASIQPCDRGQAWDWDGVHFDVLHPDYDEVTRFKKTNNRSCVIRVSTGKASVLLTGDIEARVEQKLLKLAETGRITIAANVMLVPHHGSRTSSTEDFIRQVQPQFALLPVGYRNRYGFPKLEIVERYLQQNVTLLDTAQHGAIQFYVDSSGKVELVQTYRQSGQHFWHRDSLKMYTNYTVMKQ
jgi:competence protein ComEC